LKKRGLPPRPQSHRGGLEGGVYPTPPAMRMVIKIKGLQEKQFVRI
jgi:hypothetical protein